MTNKNIKFRKLEQKDWEQVAEIYQQGIATQKATFEQTIPSWDEWSQNHLTSCRAVAEMKDLIVGWYALSPVSSRCVYGGVAEVSIYVSNDFTGQKIGTKLLDRLITESEQNGIWTLEASIFPENKGSLNMHKKLGFRKVGYREKLGKMNGVWRDTVLLERRSLNIGID